MLLRRSDAPLSAVRGDAVRKHFIYFIIFYSILFRFILYVSDDDMTDKLVSVQVDDEESMIQFIDIPGSEVYSTLSPHSFLVSVAFFVTVKKYKNAS